MRYKFLNPPLVKDVIESILPGIPEKHFTNTEISTCFASAFEENTYLKLCVEHVKPWTDVAFIAIVSVWSDLQTHVYSDHLREGTSKYSLDIPLSNCIDTCTEFFEPLDNFTGTIKMTNQVMPEGTTFYSYNPDQMLLVDKLYLRMPALVDLTQPRRHANHNEKPKIYLSVVFNTPFDFEIQ